MIQTNFYDKQIYFAILWRGYSTYILEPDKWNKITEHIPRDPKYYGFWSDFLEDKYGMRFTFLEDKGLTGGGFLLKQIYETKGEGANALVYFSVGYWNCSTPVQINQWRINLNEYECQFPGGVLTSIEKMPFQGLLRSRMSAPCTVNDYTGFDGELLTPIENSNIRLHSKSIYETSEFSSNGPKDTGESLEATLDTYFVIQPDQQDQSISELNQVFTQPCSFLNTTSNLPAQTGSPTDPTVATSDGIYTSLGPPPVVGDPYKNLISQYNSTTNGSLQIKWSGSVGSFFWWQGGAGNMFFKLTPSVVVIRNVGGIKVVAYQAYGTTVVLSSGGAGTSPNPTPPMIGYFNDTATPGGIAPVGTGTKTDLNLASTQFILPSVTGSTPRKQCNQVDGYIWDETFDNIPIQIADEIYVHILMTPFMTSVALASHFIQGIDFLNTITYKQLTSLPGSIAPMFRIFDILNQQLEAMTGEKDSLISPFFDVGGFGRNYFLSNGYGIRNYGGKAYKMKKDFMSTIDSLQSVFCLGAGIKRVATSVPNKYKEYFVLDYIPNFFSNGVIARYDNTFGWKAINNPKVCYNKAELGYEKFEGLNIIQQDEINTQGSYLLQFLQYTDNTLSKRSGIIASEFLLEEERRNQFLASTQQRLTNDDDWFIVATSEPNIWYRQNPQFLDPLSAGLSFANDNPVIGFEILMFLVYGDSINIDFGGALGIMNFSILNQCAGFPKYSGVLKDGYQIINQQLWASGTWGRNSIVYDSSVNLWFLCYVTVTSATPPVSDPTHWIQWDSIYAGHANFSIEVIPSSPDQIFAERNQPFEVCAGVIDPSTIYNGRLSLKHILYNWRPVLGVGLDFINPNDMSYQVSQIVTTLVKMNSLFTSKFRSTETNKGNAGTLKLVEIEREFVFRYLLSGENIYSPQGAECKIKIGQNELNLIRASLCGETGTYTDYGGVILNDDFGINWFCHIEDIQYDLVKEIATLKVQKVKKVI
jgi:hypothetical protein